MFTVVHSHEDLLKLATQIARAIPDLARFKDFFDVAIQPNPYAACDNCRRSLIGNGVYARILTLARLAAIRNYKPEDFAKAMEALVFEDCQIKED